MKALLVFDNVNDLVFSQWDDEFIERMKTLGQQEVEGDLSDNDAYNVSQLFSPIVTSQRVMAAQFANTYVSMQCKDAINLAFDEWLDHILLVVGTDEVDELHRELLDLKTFIQHICGHNFRLLHSHIYQQWLSELVRSRCKGDYVPGAGGVIGESGASAAALAALKTTAGKLKAHAQHFHLLLYVGDKLLALYSSRGCEDLTPGDVILLSVQCVAAQEFWHHEDHQSETTEHRDGPTKPAGSLRVPWLSEENSAIVNLCGGRHGNPCCPHSMHIAPVAPRLTFVVLLDMELRDVGISACTSVQILSNLRRILLQRNLESLPPIVESLENSIKKTIDAVRRNKANTNLCTRLSSRMLELKKSCTTTTPLTPETSAASMNTALESVIEKLRPDIPQLNLSELLEDLQEKLAPYVDFLKVKAMRYFSLASYMEEFPGLIHFVLIDRTLGRFVAPDIADCAEILDKEKMSAALRQGMRLVREGYTAATWRRGALHACLVLWQQSGGAAVCPRPLHRAAVRALPPPGDILGTFYRQLTELCFPDTPNVVVKELLCIHLGLLPATTAVEQARRLAHTIQDEAYEFTPNPADLL